MPRVAGWIELPAAELAFQASICQTLLFTGFSPKANHAEACSGEKCETM